MVNIVSQAQQLWVLADQSTTQPLIERLDPPRRAGVVMALLVITILGLFLITVVLLGGNWARRLARRRYPRSDGQANIENERLRSVLQPILPTGSTGETTIAKRTSNDTIAGH
jgi:hypothetical protein